ncbi:MAG: hypothetical protein KC478_06620 [Bacteriovoracaceae bacterium]|nr:hypothetical protein [Bacteriovoracaceae bacterium]
MDYLKIAILPLNEAKEIQSQLATQGVEIRLDHNETTCRRGCTVTVEMWAKQDDIPAVQKTFSENFAQSLEGHDVDWSRLSEVFDPSKDSAVCPACGENFSTSSSECPGCGLNLGV